MAARCRREIGFSKWLMSGVQRKRQRYVLHPGLEKRKSARRLPGGEKSCAVPEVALGSPEMDWQPSLEEPLRAVPGRATERAQALFLRVRRGRFLTDWKYSSSVTKSPLRYAASPRRMERNSASVAASVGIVKYSRSASTATSDGFRFSRRAARSTRRPTAAGNSIMYCGLLISSPPYHPKIMCQDDANALRADRAQLQARVPHPSVLRPKVRRGGVRVLNLNRPLDDRAQIPHPEVRRVRHPRGSRSAHSLKAARAAQLDGSIRLVRSPRETLLKSAKLSLVGRGVDWRHWKQPTSYDGIFVERIEGRRPPGISHN